MREEKCITLLIDDHPIIRNAYKESVRFVERLNDTGFEIYEAGNCDEAVKVINRLENINDKIWLVFLDISLPPTSDKKIVSGEDLGLWIKRRIPRAKIIVSTTFNDNYRLHNILRNLDPDGFLIKSDITPKDLVEAVETVLADPPYYSKTVLRLVRQEVASEFILDEIDRKLLYELSLGTLMKDLPEILHLSLAGIEKRKRHLKEIFDLKTSTDKELLALARDKGFI